MIKEHALTVRATYDWTVDERVAPILARIARDGAQTVHWKGFSDTSLGQKSYWRYCGPDVDALDLVCSEYSLKAWEEHEAWEILQKNSEMPDWKSDLAPMRQFGLIPTAHDIVRYVLNEWIDYRGNDRDAYFAKLDAIYPLRVAK